MSLISGLHGPRVPLTMAKPSDDLVVISVICFPRIISNLVSLRGTRDWLESGCPNSEYGCELGLV